MSNVTQFRITPSLTLSNIIPLNFFYWMQIDDAENLQ